LLSNRFSVFGGWQMVEMLQGLCTRKLFKQNAQTKEGTYVICYASLEFRLSSSSVKRIPRASDNPSCISQVAGREEQKQKPLVSEQKYASSCFTVLLPCMFNWNANNFAVLARDCKTLLPSYFLNFCSPFF
jgi:hypothetical protein